MNRTNKLLRYLSIWLRPPKVARVRVEESEGKTVDIVGSVFVLSTGRRGAVWPSHLLRRAPKMPMNDGENPQLIRHSRLAFKQYEASLSLSKEVVRGPGRAT